MTFENKTIPQLTAELEETQTKLDQVRLQLTQAQQKIDEYERKMSERNLTLDVLLSNLAGMAYKCLNDSDWTMEYVSSGCFELLGYTALELQAGGGVSYNDLIHPDDQDALWENCQAHLNAHQRCSNEYRIITKSGATRWVWDQAKGIYSDSGELLCIEGFITDITSRKQAEKDKKQFEEIQTVQQRLKKAERIARLGHWEWNILDDVMYWSDEIYRILNAATRDFDINYQVFIDYIHPQDMEMVRLAMDRALQKITPFDLKFRIISDAEEILDVHAQAEVNFDIEGNPLLMLGTIQNITKRE